MAEALADWHYNRGESAQVSRFTVEQFRRVVDGRIGEAINEGTRITLDSHVDARERF
jgi:hypothetical protein